MKLWKALVLGLSLFGLTAKAQVASVVSTNALALRVPSATSPLVIVSPADGSSWALWRYAPASTSTDWDNALVTTLGTGRWLKVSYGGPGGGGGGGGGSGTVTSITLTQPAAGLTITGSGTAITSTGTPTFALANDLAAVEGLSGTGYVKRTATDTWGTSSTVPWSDVASTPTTLSGYGITDGATIAYVDGADLATYVEVVNNFVPQTRSVNGYALTGNITVNFADLGAKPTTLSGYGITDAQGLDSDLTSIAALTTTTFGRSLLTQADAPTARTALGLVIGADVQAYDADLSIYAGITPSANVQSLLGAADYAAMRTQLGLVIGSNVQAYDADLDDLADGTLSGSKVGSGINAANITAGTLPDARFPATLPAASGANLTSLNAGNLSSGTVASARLPSPGRPVTYVVDNSGSAITAGDSTIASVPVEVTGTITKAVLLADVSGSAVVDVRKSTYSGFPTVSSIAASAKPTLSASQKSQDTTLTGWTTSVTAGDVLQFRVDSASTVTRLTLVLTITPP